MNRLRLILLITLTISISALAQTSVKVGSLAPGFSGTTIDGTAIDLAELRGSVVVMTFWSTRCAICQTEMPKLNRFAAGYDPKKVVFLALSMENEDKINGYLQRNPFKFQVMPNSFGVVLSYADRDKNGNIDMGFPSFFVIDQAGLVRYRSSGYDKTEPLDAAISKLLAN